MHTAKLDEIVRQKDPALKSAVELLATGQVSAALDALHQQGRVREIPNREERVRAIAMSYVQSPENTLIVSPDNASRRELNVAVRQELKATGVLAPEDHTFRVLVQRQDMTGAERSWASHYEINDVVRYTRGSKAIGIGAAAYASVVAIDPSPNQLTVEKAKQELATYDPRRLTGVSVYREIEREFRRQFKLALHLILLTLVRKAELLLAQWKDVDLGGEWKIPAENSKTEQPHTVYLSTQATKLFQELKALAGGSAWVMPGRSGLLKPFSHNAMNQAMGSITALPSKSRRLRFTIFGEPVLPSCMKKASLPT